MEASKSPESNKDITDAHLLFIRNVHINTIVFDRQNLRLVEAQRTLLKLQQQYGAENVHLWAGEPWQIQYAITPEAFDQHQAQKTAQVMGELSIADSVSTETI
jgi:hypothetical protein